MEQNKINQGPVDYSDFFKQNKQPKKIDEEQPIVSAQNQAIGPQKSSFLKKINLWWQMSDKKTKIELLVVIGCLILTITFLTLLFAKNKNLYSAPSIQPNPAEFIPAEGI